MHRSLARAGSTHARAIINSGGSARHPLRHCGRAPLSIHIYSHTCIASFERTMMTRRRQCSIQAYVMHIGIDRDGLSLHLFFCSLCLSISLSLPLWSGGNGSTWAVHYQLERESERASIEKPSMLCMYTSRAWIGRHCRLAAAAARPID